MSCKFVLNCGELVNWQRIINAVSKKKGVSIVPDRSDTNDEYRALYDLWDSVGLNYEGVKWTNYYPRDYDSSVATILEKELGVTHIRSWISRIDPGYSAPWHYDIDHNEEDYLKLGTLRRFICFIGEPAPGHASFVESQCFCNERSGNVYEWSDYRAWHAGSNAGLTPKYQYNFLAYS